MTYKTGGFDRILNDVLLYMIYILLYLPECKMTLIVDNPHIKHVCQGKMYLSKSKTAAYK